MAALPQQPAVLSFEEARHVVEQHVVQARPWGVEGVDLLSALGRVLALPIPADRDFPPFRRAMRDGYAVRAADLAQLPVTLEVIGEIKAGAAASEIPREVNPGQAVAIMTGAPTPSGADAVVMVEYTKLSGDRVTITRAIAVGDNIVPVGSEAWQGQILLEQGTRLDYSGIAVMASVGKQQSVPVYCRPRVAILSTGDEVVDVGEVPGPTQIRNSNSYSLAAQVQDAGGDPRLLGIARDDAGSLRTLIAKGLELDLLLMTGGVSMGKYDLVEEVLASLGAEFFFTGAAIQPGKPVVFGRVMLDGKAKLFFGLPGNPVSTMVTFQLFVRPIIDALGGAKPEPLPFVQAALQERFTTKTGLTRFLPGKLGGTHERPEVELVRWQGSGDLMAASRSNCYIVVPPDREEFAAGEAMTVLLS